MTHKILTEDLIEFKENGEFRGNRIVIVAKSMSKTLERRSAHSRHPIQRGVFSGDDRLPYCYDDFEVSLI